MDEQFDKNLRDRIREVFENYNDPSAADEGWLQLRKKYPEGRDRRPVAWLWRGAAAALLLLALGTGLWISNERVQPKKLADKITKPAKPENLATTNVSPGKTDYKAKHAGEKNLGRVSEKNTTFTKASLAKTSTRQYYSIQIGTKKASNDVSTEINAIAQNTVIAKKIVDSGTTKIDKAPVQQPAIISQTTTAQAVQIKKPQPPDKSINALFANDKGTAAEADNKTKKGDRRVRFAIYAATYFNYAKGSDNQVNMGAGFTSDIALGKNLRLVTGIAIAQNSLNFSGNPPAAIQQNSFVLAAASQTASFSNAYLSSAALPTFKNYNASLVGLDIPINLKYEFNPQKSDTYISAGFSSGTFIDETYTYQYNYPAFFSPSLQQTQGQTVRNSFNGFYFAKTLNLAFGVGYPLGKNHLIIEPFLKYPLDGLGSQQLRFGAGGLNLKFNFQSSKK